MRGVLPTRSHHSPLPRFGGVSGLLAGILTLLLAGSSQAAPPALRELRPWGAQRGQTVTLTLSGDRLAGGAEVFSALPGKLEEQPGATPGQMAFKLELRPDAELGVYPLRVRTAAGLSNTLLFSIGDLPEVGETEPNDVIPAGNPAAAGAAADAATPDLKLPVTVNGSVSGSDQDLFRVVAKKGERLVIEVEAQRIGSALDPAVHVLTASGRELAFSDDTPGLGVDARIDLTVPDEGELWVSVHDSKYAGGSPGHYRLKAGPLAYAESIFPLGWQRGAEVDVALLGGTFTEPGKLRFSGQGRGGSNRAFVPATPQGVQARLPFRFMLGDAPEALEPAGEAERWFRDAAVMNGRIAEAGEVDRYKFPVQPGQVWLFEMDAASLGSRLDGVLSVFGPQGNLIASADDGNGLDPRLQFQVPAGIESIVLAVEDLHRRGGVAFPYRLKARPVRADFTLQVVPPIVNIPRRGTALVQVRAIRNGYNGPIQLVIPENAPGITAEDGLIPEGAPEGFLVLSAAADAPLRFVDLEIAGRGGPPAKPMNRPASPGPRNSQAVPEPFATHIPASICEAPPAILAVAERSVRVLHGYGKSLKITAERGASATEVIVVTGVGVPPQFVSGTAGKIDKGSNEVTLDLQATPENPQVGSFTLQLSAKTAAAGAEETIQLPPVRVEVARPFAVELLNPSVNMSAGSKIRLSAVVRREAPFDGNVRIGPIGGLPEHVTISSVDVPKGESLAVLELAIGEMAGPAEFDVQIRASTEMEGRKRDKDYNIPDSPVRVKISPKAGS